MKSLVTMTPPRKMFGVEFSNHGDRTFTNVIITGALQRRHKALTIVTSIPGNGQGSNTLTYTATLRAINESPIVITIEGVGD